MTKLDHSGTLPSLVKVLTLLLWCPSRSLFACVACMRAFYVTSFPVQLKFPPSSILVPPHRYHVLQSQRSIDHRSWNTALGNSEISSLQQACHLWHVTSFSPSSSSSSSLSLSSTSSLPPTTTTTTTTTTISSNEYSASSPNQETDATSQMRLESEHEMSLLLKHYQDQEPGEIGPSKPVLMTFASQLHDYIEQHSINTILFDCDGVLYRSPHPAPGARECIVSLLLDEKKHVYFVTNNAGTNRQELCTKLTNILQLEKHSHHHHNNSNKNNNKNNNNEMLTEDMMISSSYSCAMYLQRRFTPRTSRDDNDNEINRTPRSPRVYVIGSIGLCQELQHFGMDVVRGDCTSATTTGTEIPSMTRDELAAYPFDNVFPPNGNIDAVVVGHDVQLNYRKLCIANILLQKNPHALFIATNRDSHDLVGNDRRKIPGNGGAVVFLEYTSGRTAINVGKPSPILMELIFHRSNNNNNNNDATITTTATTATTATTIRTPQTTMMVGDRLDTDIQFGKVCGMHTALVMTGVTTAEQLAALGNGTPDEPLPDIILPHVGLFGKS
jgi:4-nitrophenyl phosphatase